MSRVAQYDKNETYLNNLSSGNYKREKRMKDEQDEIARDKEAMDRLRKELKEEELYEKNRKKQLKEQQFQEYSNYMRQKYSVAPDNRESLNIKLGGENRFIKKPSYNQQMDNLVLNPMRQAVTPNEPFHNYSRAGRDYQRGNSHGYNILTGEILAPKKEIEPQSNLPNEEPKQDSKLTGEDYERYMQYMAEKKAQEQGQKKTEGDLPKEYKEMLMKKEDENKPRDVEVQLSQKEEEEIYKRYLMSKQQQERMGPEQAQASGNKPINTFDEYLKLKNVQGQGMNDRQLKLQEQMQQENMMKQYPPVEPKIDGNEYIQRSYRDYEQENMPPNYKQQGNIPEMPPEYMQNQIPPEYALKGQQIPPEYMPREQQIPPEYLQQLPPEYLQKQIPPNYYPPAQELPPEYLQQPQESNNYEEPEQISNPILNARNEYLANRKKNLTSYDNIFSGKDIPLNPKPKYNDKPMTKYDKIQMQKEYAKFLDGQINAKQVYKNTMMNLQKEAENNTRSNPNINPEVAFLQENPYSKIREKKSKLQDIPNDPYSTKNFNFGVDSYLKSNPITGGGEYNKRQTQSGRLQNNGSNIVRK